MAKTLFLCLAFAWPCILGSRTFLHLSDIHLDFEYVENGIDSKDKMCHAAAPGQHKGNASKYGSYHCDPPRLLVESAFEAMKKFVPNPDFILWTGDNSPHVKNVNTSEVMRHLRFVTKKLNQQYPGIPVIPVLGNHDSSPADFFPERSPNHLTYYEDYITEGSFADFLNVTSRATEQFKHCGYYVMRNKTLYENVTQTFIVLNTALYYHNKAILNMTDLPPDPCGQFEWFQKTLDECKPNERVFIVAHVPPGYFEHYAVEPMFMDEKYTKAYLKIVTKKDNAKKIFAHFYAHLHTDSFRLFMDEFGSPVGLAFLAPSITPLVYVRDGVNPSFREYYYDPWNKTILTYKQYYLPLDKLLPDEEEEFYDQDEKLIGTNMGPPKYLSIQGHQDCLETETKKDYKALCLPKNKPSKCKDDAWKALQNVNMDKCVETVEKTTSRNEKTIGMASPEYLTVPGFKNCTESKTFSTHTERCMPETRPLDCTEDSWTKLQKVFFNPKCDEASNHQKDSDRRSKNSKFLGKREVNLENLQDEEVSEENATTNESIIDENIENLETNENDNSTNMPSKQSDDIAETTTISNEIDAKVNNQLSDSSDKNKDLSKMVKSWTFGYDAALNYDIASMDIKSMHKVYTDIKNNAAGMKFKTFWKQSFVLRGIDPLYCDDSCHANISCTITFFTKEDFKDCLVKYNQPINVPTEIVKTPDRSVFKTSTTTKIYPRYTTVNPLITSTKQSIWTKEPDIGISGVPDLSESGTSGVGRGIAIGCVFVVIITMIIVGIYVYKRIQRRRYCSQEFLLDSFRYDGYSQIDQP